MCQEEADRRELNNLLDELEQRQLYCNRKQLTEIVFSPGRKPGERLIERLQWLLMTDGFWFSSPLSRNAGARALTILAGYTGQEVAARPPAERRSASLRTLMQARPDDRLWWPPPRYTARR